MTKRQAKELAKKIEKFDSMFEAQIVEAGFQRGLFFLTVAHPKWGEDKASVSDADRWAEIEADILDYWQTDGVWIA